MLKNYFDKKNGNYETKIRLKIKFKQFKQCKNYKCKHLRPTIKAKVKCNTETCTLCFSKHSTTCSLRLHLTTIITLPNSFICQNA